MEFLLRYKIPTKDGCEMTEKPLQQDFHKLKRY